MENKKPLPHQHDSELERVIRQMPEAEDFARAASMFQQLGDSTRLRILWLLCHCEECGVNIAAAVGQSTAVVSHHLRLLRLNGLVSSRRDGKEVYYTLADTVLARLLHRMVDDLFQVTCPNCGEAAPCGKSCEE